ncbi:hypothetical protein GCM10025776_00840 [Corallincola platygyrae]
MFTPAHMQIIWRVQVPKRTLSMERSNMENINMIAAAMTEPAINW